MLDDFQKVVVNAVDELVCRQIGVQVTIGIAKAVEFARFQKVEQGYGVGVADTVLHQDLACEFFVEQLAFAVVVEQKSPVGLVHDVLVVDAKFHKLVLVVQNAKCAVHVWHHVVQHVFATNVAKSLLDFFHNFLVYVICVVDVAGGCHTLGVLGFVKVVQGDEVVHFDEFLDSVLTWANNVNVGVALGDFGEHCFVGIKRYVGDFDILAGDTFVVGFEVILVVVDVVRPVVHYQSIWFLGTVATNKGK